MERYPLQVMVCSECSLSQLSVVVDPEVMFRNYYYHSSVNGGYVEHCRKMAEELIPRLGLKTSTTDFGSFVIDIAGNDGALLYEFGKVLPGLRSLNVDPARNMAPLNEAKNVRQFAKFWSMDTAQQIGQLGWPKADLITATNVFAHVDNTREFLEAAKFALTDNGVLVLEFPYLLDYIENNEWPTTYHEHLSYFSIRPLLKLCHDTGLCINRITRHDIHCGTLRVEISKHPGYDPCMDIYLNEPDVLYGGYQEQLNKCVVNIQAGLDSLPGKVAAFAASAKGITLLNAIPDASRIDYVVDETPDKRGRFIPGVGLPIVGINALTQNPPDTLIILAWNFAFEIMQRCRAAGYVGKFIIPIPEWREVE